MIFDENYNDQKLRTIRQMMIVRQKNKLIMMMMSWKLLMAAKHCSDNDVRVAATKV